MENGIGESGVLSLSKALKINSSITLLSLEVSLILKYDLIVVKSMPNFMENNIGDSGVLSLSKALKVNSFITLLNLEVSLFLNDDKNKIKMCHIPWGTILVNQVYYHYQKH